MMQNANWIFTEIKHAGQEHLDLSYVQTYDRKAGTDPSKDLQTLRSLGLNETHTVIDFGAGTGTFALAVAPFCHGVIAVDLSSTMLTQLQQKATEQKINNVTCVQQGFLSYEHQGGQVDFIYSRHALHHIPDFWKVVALKRLARILKPGGILMLRDLIFSCTPDEVNEIIDDWLASASATPDFGWTRTELEIHLREEHSTFSWLLEPMLHSVGFEIQKASHDDSRVRSAYICVKQ